LLCIAESRKYHPVVVLLHNDKGLKKISTKFHQVLKQSSVFYLRLILCPSIFRHIAAILNGFAAISLSKSFLVIRVLPNAENVGLSLNGDTDGWTNRIK
jgi:hypothetical protein